MKNQGNVVGKHHDAMHRVIRICALLWPSKLILGNKQMDFSCQLKSFLNLKMKNE